MTLGICQGSNSRVGMFWSDNYNIGTINSDPRNKADTVNLIGNHTTLFFALISFFGSTIQDFNEGEKIFLTLYKKY